VLAIATRVLRVGFARPSDDAPRALPPDDLIDFVAYTREFLVAGLIAMRADRMTDLLNAVDELELSDPVVQWLADGSVRGSDRLSIRRSELIAVKAGDPRGNPARRHPTGRVSVGAGSGTTLMHGHLHVRRGGDAATDLGRRPAMIPLTDATIRFTVGGEARVDAAETLIVNRDAADWMRPTTEEAMVALVHQYRSAELQAERIAAD
jgi:hypothetical protein